MDMLVQLAAITDVCLAHRCAVKKRHITGETCEVSLKNPLR